MARKVTKVKKKVNEYLDKTKARVPMFEDSYETVREFHANNEYSKIFLEHVTNDINEKHGLRRTTSVLNSLKRFTVINKETFFYVNFRDTIRDLGTAAFKGNERSLIDFTSRALELMSIRRSRGEKDIDVSSILFYLAHIVSNIHQYSQLNICIKMFVTSLITGLYNPFKLDIYHLWVAPEMLGAMGLDRDACYWNVVARVLTELNERYGRVAGVRYPKLTLIAPVHEDKRAAKLRYLARLFNVSYSNTKKVFWEVYDLTADSPEMLTGLNQMRGLSEQKAKEYDYAAILKHLWNMDRSDMMLAYTQPSTLFNYFEAGRDIPREVIKRFDIKPVFYEEETLLAANFNFETHIIMDCSDLKDIGDMQTHMHNAVMLMLLRIRDHKKNQDITDKIYNNDTGMLITLADVKNYTVSFVNDVRGFEKKLRSYYNRNIKVRIQYDYNTAISRTGKAETEYIRVISDIHTDVNKDKNYVFDFGDDFVVNCGDTSGDCETTRAWVRSYMRDGVFVAGNHLGYTMPYPERNGPQNIKNWGSVIDPKNTKNGQADYLHSVFRGNVKFLSNDIKEFQDIIFIGNTLYTDFKLFGSKNQIPCMVEASRRLNDFRYCYYLYVKKKNKIKDGYVREYTPEFHLKQHQICMIYLKRRLDRLRKDGNTKPIVIVTHHAPMPFCVEDEYKNDPLSAAFASDLREFVNTYPEIRLWCYGHVHTPQDFIYNRTRFVCEPWGYFNENGFDIDNYGKRIKISHIKSNSPWRYLLVPEIEAGKVKIILQGTPEDNDEGIDPRDLTRSIEDSLSPSSKEV